MKINNTYKQLILVFPAAILAVLLIFTITKYLNIQEDQKRASREAIRTEEQQEKIISQNNNNPNDCLYSSCANFY